MNDDAGPAPGTWLVSRKSGGVSPGVTIEDERGKTYFVPDAPPMRPGLVGAEPAGDQQDRKAGLK